MNAPFHPGNPVQRAIEARTSAHHYVPGPELPEQLVAALVAQAARAPSAYHFQNWRFIAVTSPQAKLRLLAVAHGQRKVVDAAVTFIVSGILAPHEMLAKRLEPCVDAGVMDHDTAASWLAQAHASYDGNAVRQRDEAIRSASLAAMTLMLAAQGMGLASCPMVGFDADALAREFGLHGDELPVMLVTVGHPAADNWPQKPRRPVSEILDFV